jgi:hypothetical protein
LFSDDARGSKVEGDGIKEEEEVELSESDIANSTTTAVPGAAPSSYHWQKGDNTVSLYNDCGAEGGSRQSLLSISEQEKCERRLRNG